jgi:hypothetical protein
MWVKAPWMTVCLRACMFASSRLHTNTNALASMHSPAPVLECRVRVGSGLYISWGAMYFMKQLGIVPKRTIRYVHPSLRVSFNRVDWLSSGSDVLLCSLTGWLCEEYGSPGARQYFNDHKSELK